MKRVPFILLLVSTVLLSSCGVFKKGSTSELGFAEKRKFQDLYYKASKQKILENKFEAVTLFEKALEVNPKSHATMYQIANLKFALHDLSSAIYMAEQSIKLNPEYNFWYYGQLGQFYNRQGLYTEAGEIFKKMAGFEPERKSNYIESANQFMNALDFKNALSMLEEYERMFGIDEQSARKMEGLFGELKKPEKANAAMEKLVAANPGNIRYMGLLAESYLRAQKVDRAKAIYEQMIEQDPGNGYAHFGLADISRKAEKEGESYEHMLKAFEDEEVSIALKLQVVQSFFPFLRSDSTMRSRAFRLMEILETVHSQEPNVFIAFSDILYTSGDANSARNKLRRSLELDASNFNGWQQLIALNSEIGDFEAMEKDSKKFLDRFPVQPLPYLSNSHANMLLGFYEQAIHVAQEGLEISRLKEDKSQLLITLATSFYEIEEFKKSDDAHDELLELAPNDDLALNNYAYFLAVRGQRLEKAREMSEKALSISPNNVSYLDTYGWVLFKSGKFDEAIKPLKRAYKLDSNDPEILEHLGETLMKLNRIQEAESIFKKLEKINKHIQSGI